VTCLAELKRRFATPDAASAYLRMRGFLCLPEGWGNGRWAATMEKAGSGVLVTVWLRLDEAA
jgi:hypothetical protein